MSAEAESKESLFIPRDSTLAEKIVENAHIKTMYEGVNLTMTEMQREYLIPRLQSLTKRVRKACYGWKTF